MDYSQFILPQFPDYLIYPTGEIYSLRSKKHLKTRFDKNGYKRVDIKNVITNRVQTMLIHKLVAIKYLNHIPTNGLVVDHIDNNKLNNAVHNLQILSPIQNTLKYFYSKVQKNGLPACIYYKAKKNVYVFKLKTTDCDYNIECTNLLDCITKKNEIFKNIINGKLD